MPQIEYDNSVDVLAIFNPEMAARVAAGEYVPGFHDPDDEMRMAGGGEEGLEVLALFNPEMARMVAGGGEDPDAEGIGSKIPDIGALTILGGELTNESICDQAANIDWSNAYCHLIEGIAKALEDAGCADAAAKGREHADNFDCKAAPLPGGP